MNYSKTFAAAFLIIFGVLQVFAQNLNQFYYEESNAIQWQQRYAAAPTGSWEEQQARQQRDISVERAIQSVSYYSFQGVHWSQIENFVDQMNQKYLAAPTGGAIQRMYRQVRDTSYQAFNTELQNYVQYFSNDWRQIHELALQMDQKYAAAPSGSQKERAYNQARQTAYQRMPQAVDQELYRLYNFREAERLAEYFSQLYSVAPTNSLKENTYYQILRNAFNHAIQKFSQQAYSLPQKELWQIQEDYNRRYNAAPTGSAREAYFRQIRDIARNSIRP
jgi:hypothetical protein